MTDEEKAKRHEEMIKRLNSARAESLKRRQEFDKRYITEHGLDAYIDYLRRGRVEYPE